MRLRTLRSITLFTLAVLLLAITGAAGAHDEGDIVVYNVWVRPTTGGEGGMAGVNHSQHGGMGDASSTTPSAAYFVVENRGGHDVRLASISTPVAERAEIHQTIVENDIARMEPVEDGVEIPEGETFAFEPGGYHVMLFDLLFDLKPGDYLAMTLSFEMVGGQGDPMEVTTGAMVQDVPYETGGVVAWVNAVHYEEDAPESATAELTLEYRGEDENLLADIEHMGMALPFTQRALEGDAAGAKIDLDLGPMFEMMFVPDSLALPITIVLEDGTRFDLALPFSAAHEASEHADG